MLTDADWCLNKVQPGFLLSERTSGASPVIFRCEDGEAKISCGYKLPARYVISTVGPMGEHPKVLENAYLNSLKVMKANNLRSIAFPCISTGIYGYPNESACTVVLRMVRYFLERNKDSVDRVFIIPQKSFQLFSFFQVLDFRKYIFKIIELFSGCLLPLQKRGCCHLQR